MASGTSYNGWPAHSDPTRIGINQAWEPIPGHKFPGGIKAGDVEVIFTYLVRQLHLRVERIELYPAGDEWGYNFKQSANSPDLLSCHASGTAIDYNAVRHPNGVRNTWAAAQVAEIRKILSELGGVIRWLYDAARTPDEMHFEVKGTAADVKAVADRIRNKPQEMFTVAQFDEIMRELGAIKGGVLVAIDEGRELDDDIPENLADIERENRVNLRTVLEEMNRVRAKEGLAPLPIVIGYNGNTPIYKKP